MSVIQRIRDRGAWIMFGIIALALIAFILQDGVKRGGNANATTTIGKVNGQNIERADFEEKLTQQEQMYGPQGAQRYQLIGSLWNQEIDKIVMEQECYKLGLLVSPKELSEILFGKNSPLRQEFTDKTTGEFKVNDAKQAIAQIKKSKNAEQKKMINNVYITPSIDQTLHTKYQNLLMQAVYIPKWLLEKQQADNNSIASLSYVYVPYASVNDSTVKVYDRDISDYVKNHAKEFKKEEETRGISYVTFSAAPSGADTAAVLSLLEGLKKEFSNTTEVAQYLTKAGTDLPYYNSYFNKDKMQQANKDSLTKIRVGGLYGPYLDGPSYVIAKMVATKQWPDSVTVRHILIATADPRSGQQIRPDTLGKRLIDSIETAIKGGADFTALCAKYSDDGGSKDKDGTYEYFEQGKMAMPFNDFAFDKPIGSKGVVKTDYGYHYVENLAQKNKNPVYKLAYLAKAIISSNETVAAANAAASQFAVSAKDQKQFTSNAVKENKQILNSNEVKQNDFSVVGLGQSRQLVRWIFEHGVGDVSDPIEIGDKYVVTLVSAINSAGLQSVSEARPSVETIVRNEKKAKQIIATKFKGTDLASYATSTGAPVLRADSLSYSAPFILGVGSEPKIVGAAFNKTLMTKSSEPIAGATGVFSIKIESNGAKPATSDLSSLKQSQLQSAKMSSYRGMEALKKAATIKDSRSKVY